MLLPMSVYLILLFDLIIVTASLLLRFIFAVWRIRCPCLPVWAVLCCVYFLCSLLRRIFFVPYAYYMSLSFLYFAFVFFSWFSLLNPLLATTPFASYFDVRFIMSAFPVCLFCFVLSGRVRSRFGLVWLRLSCDHSWIPIRMRDKKQQQRVQFCVVSLFCCFVLFVFSCDIGESGMGTAPLLFLGS